MAGTLKVDIAGLIGASSEVADRAGALAGSHTNSLTGLAAAEAGWVGASADALVAMAEKWQVLGTPPRWNATPPISTLRRGFSTTWNNATPPS